MLLRIKIVLRDVTKGVCILKYRATVEDNAKVPLRDAAGASVEHRY